MLPTSFWKVLWFNVRWPSQARVFEHVVPAASAVLGDCEPVKFIPGVQALEIISLLCFHYTLPPDPLRVKQDPLTIA